jgi:hypothetical protein
MSVDQRHAPGSGEVRYPLARVYRIGPYRLSLAMLARRSGTPPELLLRFAALGLLDARRDAAGRLWFRPGAPATVARVQRLRTGLCLNYAGVGVVLDLLDRIERLQAVVRRGEQASRERTLWT